MGSAAVVLVVLFVGAGCKSSGSTAPDTGAGGQSGLDGAADHLASGGSGGGGAVDGSQDAQASSCLGVCLETFFAQCPKIGQSCTTATISGGEVINCYANGVKQAQIQSNAMTTTVVQTAQGQTCYESDLAATIETIKDLDGKMIAQITPTSSTQLTIECYGIDGSVATTHADLTTAGCAATYAATTQTCTAGTCTFD